MAKVSRFRTPPNWPTPPAGWTPPPNWQPDPAWGPVPEGWQLWFSERVNPRGWLYALVSAVGLYAIFLVIVLIASGGGLSAEAVGELFGPFLVAFIIVGVIAQLVRSRWPVWLYPLITLGIAFGLRVLSFLGRQNAGG